MVTERVINGKRVYRAPFVGKRGLGSDQGQRLFEYIEPPGALPGPDSGRKLDKGTFALQGRDPKSTVRYRNIRVERLD